MKIFSLAAVKMSALILVITIQTVLAQTDVLIPDHAQGVVSKLASGSAQLVLAFIGFALALANWKQWIYNNRTNEAHRKEMREMNAKYEEVAHTCASAFAQNTETCRHLQATSQNLTVALHDVTACMNETRQSLNNTYKASEWCHMHSKDLIEAYAAK